MSSPVIWCCPKSPRSVSMSSVLLWKLPSAAWRRLERSLHRDKEGKSCDQARVRNDQESCNLALTRSRAEREGFYGLEGKKSGIRFVPGLKLPNRVPGFSSVVQVPRDVLVKQSTSHPDFPGETPLNLASGAAKNTSYNGGVKHVSTESELVKEAFSDPCFLKQVKSLELMLRVRDRVADRKGGSPSRCEREGAAPSVSETEFCVSEGIDGVRLVSGATTGECGIDGLLESAVLKNLAGCAVSSGRSTRGPLVRPAPVAGFEDVSVFKQNAGVASSSVRRAPVVGALRRSGPSAHATASESDRVIGLLEVTESEFPSCTRVSSCWCLCWCCCSCLLCFIFFCGVCCCTCACLNLARCTQFVVGHG